jgi:hypothetical protein
MRHLKLGTDLAALPTSSEASSLLSFSLLPVFVPIAERAVPILGHLGERGGTKIWRLRGTKGFIRHVVVVLVAFAV